MARRASKAASRRARQQRRANQQRTAPTQPSVAATDAAVAEPAVVEEAAKPAPRPETPRRARSSASTGVAPTGSTLTASERSEYHYVERDLRNIGILSLVMVGLLVLAWFLFTTTGLIG